MEEATTIDIVKALDAVSNLYHSGIPRSLIADSDPSVEVVEGGRSEEPSDKDGESISYYGPAHCGLAVFVMRSEFEDDKSSVLRELLNGIIEKGIGTELSQVGIFVWDTDIEGSFLEACKIIDNVAPTKIVLFGDPFQSLWQSYPGDVELLFTESLLRIYSDRVVKRKFWRQLQKLVA